MTAASERAALIAKGTDAAYAALNRLDAKTLGELERLYQGVADRLTARMTRYSPEGYFAQRYLQPFLKDLGVFLKELGTVRRELLKDRLTDAGMAAAENASFLDDEAVSIAVAHSVKAVWELELADGLQLSDRLWRVDAGAKQAISKALREAVARGQNPQDAGREFLSSSHLQGVVGEELLTGKGSALYNAQRVFQTEMKRAHALSYIESNKGARGLIGYRYLLSPMHRRVDICDRHANADLYGLGRGVYPPDQIRTIFPAHPNTRSYIVAVYRD